MRTLLALSLALSLVSGCSKGDSKKACEHLLDLAHAELEKTTAHFEGTDGKMNELAKDLKAKAEASRDSDLKTCIEKVEEKDVDTKCLLGADDLEEAQACLRK